MNFLNTILNLTVISSVVGSVAYAANTSVQVDLFDSANFPYTIVGVLISIIAVFTVKEVL